MADQPDYLAEMNPKTTSEIGRSPRRRRAQLVEREKLEETAILDRKRYEVERRTKVKTFEGARKSFAESLRHPKRTTEKKLVFQQPTLPASYTEGARSFLSSSSSTSSSSGATQHKKTLSAKTLDDKLKRLRDAVECGAVVLPEPGSPRPSRHSPRGKHKKAPREHHHMVHTHHHHSDSSSSSDDEEQLDRLIILTGGANAFHYAHRLRRWFIIKKSIHLYEDDPHALAEIRRIQLWLRHKRVQFYFFKLLRHRRIVIKALTRYALRFQHRNRHKSAAMVLNFYQSCFEQAGFRMAMKIFLFRCVKVQRVIRVFLGCMRARVDVLARKLEILAPVLGTENASREKTAHWVIEYAPDVLRRVIKSLRSPYIQARSIYVRSLRAGDLTPAFKEISKSGIKHFLKSGKPQHPPQYEGGVLRRPTYALYSSKLLKEELCALLDKHEKRAERHAKKLAQEAKEAKERADHEDAIRRGEGHLYELEKLKKQQETEKFEIQPADRLAEAISDLNIYGKTKTQLQVQLKATLNVEAQKERENQRKLDKIRNDMPKKIK